MKQPTSTFSIRFLSTKYPSTLDLILPIAATAIVLSVAACSDNDNQGSNDTSAITNPAVSGPAPTMPTPGSNPDDVIELEGLAGNWQQNCIANDSTQSPYSTSTLLVSNDAGTLTVTSFADNACSELLSSKISELSFVFSGIKSPTNLGDAHHVEVTDELTNAQRQDLMLVLNDSLYFGDQHSGLDGSTEDLRPVQLDEVYFYTREASNN